MILLDILSGIYLFYFYFNTFLEVLFFLDWTGVPKKKESKQATYEDRFQMLTSFLK